MVKAERPLARDMRALDISETGSEVFEASRTPAKPEGLFVAYVPFTPRVDKSGLYIKKKNRVIIRFAEEPVACESIDLIPVR